MWYALACKFVMEATFNMTKKIDLFFIWYMDYLVFFLYCNFIYSVSDSHENLTLMSIFSHEIWPHSRKFHTILCIKWVNICNLFQADINGCLPSLSLHIINLDSLNCISRLTTDIYPKTGEKNTMIIIFWSVFHMVFFIV